MADLRYLNDVLSDDEALLVEMIYKHPGSKDVGQNYATKWIDDGSEHGAILALWKKPEQLGLIKPVGSYKWIPTDRLTVAIIGDSE